MSLHPGVLMEGLAGLVLCLGHLCSSVHFQLSSGEGAEQLLGGRSMDRGCLFSMGSSVSRNWNLQSLAAQLFQCMLVSPLCYVFYGLVQPLLC